MTKPMTNVQDRTSGIVHAGKMAFSMWGRPIVIGKCGAGSRARFAPTPTDAPVTCRKCGASPTK